MAKSINDINLLPKRAGDFTETFLNWSLNIGRLLIILTEALALSVFIYRFSLDMRIVDLDDAIDQQSAITESFKSYEDSYRNLQDRLELAKKHEAKAGIIPAVFKDIIEAGRNKVTFNNISVSTELISIDVQAQSAGSLNSFVEVLRNDPRITAISIDNVENKTTTAIIQLRVTAELKEEV